MYCCPVTKTMIFLKRWLWFPFIITEYLIFYIPWRAFSTPHSSLKVTLIWGYSQGTWIRWYFLTGQIDLQWLIYALLPVSIIPMNCTDNHGTISRQGNNVFQNLSEVFTSFRKTSQQPNPGNKELLSTLKLELPCWGKQEEMTTCSTSAVQYFWRILRKGHKLLMFLETSHIIPQWKI